MEQNPFSIIEEALNEGGIPSFPEDLLKEACAEYSALKDLVLLIHADLIRLNASVSTFGLAATAIDRIERHFRPIAPEETIHSDVGNYRAGISARHLDASRVTGEPISFVRKTRPPHF